MDPIDAFVTNRTSAKALADGLRNGIKSMAEHYGFDYRDRLEWLVADKIDELITQNEKLKAELDAAVAELKISSDCYTCKYDNTGNEKCRACYSDCSEWEWRGV